MELRRYGQILWKWLWLILLGTALSGGVAYLVSRQTTPVYRASTQILVQQASNPAGQVWQDVLTSERLAANYARLLTTRPVLARVAELEQIPAVTSKIIVDPVRETQIIVLHVEDTNPAMAAAIANRLPQVFIELNEQQQQQRFASSLEAFSAQIASVQRDIEAVQLKLQEFKAREGRGEELTTAEQAQRASLETSLLQYRSSLADLMSKRDEITRAAALAGDSIRVVEPAEVPLTPVRPRVLLNTLIALALGALLMVVVAFLIEYLDDTVKLPEDAARVTGLPALGSLVKYPGNDGRRKLVALNTPRSVLAEGYRTLRTNIQFSSLDRPLRTLMVTSASPGEGKSTTVANLAVVMAQSGKRAVLVDTDLRRPVLHEIFGVANSVGLTTALLQPAGSDLSSMLQPTGCEGLWLMTSGPLPPNPSELLGSQRMAELVAQLCRQADIVLFDSPPVLAVADAAVLSRLADGVLLVVESAKTPEGAVRRAAQELARAQAPVLGVVITQLSPKLAGSNFYYYDYYRVDADEGGDRSDSQRPSRSPGRPRLAAEPPRPTAAGGIVGVQLSGTPPSHDG
ncbi:MAG: polysaccharide biosynthesis tyrosine autokinase [Caldilineales bacterium]|nr:polysaccharide biosynthesis tyrosine autokinase [Caldilineales bacterium]MDW8316214.1 polysaccharide biosynthesis tyrosine autokinase [Anaerolineae bacterium]